MASELLPAFSPCPVGAADLSLTLPHTSKRDLVTPKAGGSFIVLVFPEKRGTLGFENNKYKPATL